MRSCSSQANYLYIQYSVRSTLENAHILVQSEVNHYYYSCALRITQCFAFFRGRKSAEYDLKKSLGSVG
jgi:hypothetical protein